MSKFVLVNLLGDLISNIYNLTFLQRVQQRGQQQVSQDSLLQIKCFLK